MRLFELFSVTLVVLLLFFPPIAPHQSRHRGTARKAVKGQCVRLLRPQDPALRNAWRGPLR